MLSNVYEPIEDPSLAENVIIPESGEESEDETQERITNSQETVESQNICPDLESDNQDDEIARIEELSLFEADMASPLNPHATEFIPSTPSPTNVAPLNGLDISPLNSAMAALNFQNDRMMSQSPRKGAESTLVNIAVPEECDFLNDISKRPAELDSTVKQELRTGSSSSQFSYQEMNLKEAMHGDKKQEYAQDVLTPPDQRLDEGNLNSRDQEEFIDILNKSMRNQDPMSTSFNNDETSDSNNAFAVDLNAVHTLPTSDEENDDDTKPYSVLQADASGTTYVFEDKEFGMSDFIKMDRSDMQSDANHVSQQSEEIRSATSSDNAAGEPKVTDIDTIDGAVQEMISENMAVLNECDLLGSDPFSKAETGPLPKAETVPFEAEADPLPEVEINPLPEVESEPLPKVESEALPEAENVPHPISENVLLPEIENSNFHILDAVVLEDGSNLIPAQYEELVQQSVNVVGSESIVENQSQTNIVANEPVAEAILKSEVAAITDVSVKPKSSKAAADPKSKSTTLTAKKVSTVTSAKPKVKSVSQTDATTAKATSLPRPRTVVTQSTTKTIEKKPPTLTAAPKRSVNGDVKSTTTTATRRPISNTTTFKSTISSLPMSAVTTTKVTPTRAITKTSPTTTAVSDAAKRSLASKPSTATSATSRVRPVSEKTATLNAKSPISKLATSATDKLSKDTANKLQTATSHAPLLSPRTATTTSQRSSTIAPKKVDAVKSPTAPAPIRRPTIPSTLIQEKRPPVASATSKSLPTQKRPISPANKNRTTSETVKKSTSPLKKITKLATTATESSNEQSKPQENGNESNGIESHELNNEPI